ncbi:MAG: TonB-dependent receptor domain-containing protein [Flavipsychrobacter sp.]
MNRSVQPFKLTCLSTFLFFVLMLGSSALHAQVTGKVLDAKTKEEIIGATIYLSNHKAGDVSGLDGSYRIRHLATGTHVLHVQAMGYEKQERTINITDSGEAIAVNFLLKPLATSLNEVMVTGTYENGSDKQARAIEKNADNILNVLSARTIKLLPDITTAGILQRVSAVSLERTATGDARYAIIRGMDQRYNYTLVNGIKIPSPDNKYRYVPMDMFPADLLDRLEVIKAPTPNMEGDAIGGAMNLVMKNAPDHLTINANVAGGFSQLLADRGYQNFDRSVVNHQSPADLHGESYVATPNDFTYKNFDYKKRSLPLNRLAGFSIGNRFLRRKQLGIIIAGSYSNLFRGSNTTWLKPNNQPAPGNVPSFDDIYIRQYNTQQTRYGLHNKIDYAINEKNKISLYNLFLEMDEIQTRTTIDTSLSIGRSGTGTGNTYLLYRSRMQNQSIYNSTLQGEHTLAKDLDLNWSAVYSLAKQAMPDWSEYQTVQVVGFDINHNHVSTDPVLNIPFYRIWTRNSDQDLAGYLNLSYKKHIGAQEVILSAGGLYRSKTRDNHYNEWDLIPKTSSTGQPVIFDGQLSPDKFQFNGITAAQGSPVNPLTYTATEKITAYYAQANIILFDKLSILGGVRVEHTEQGWHTAQDPKISYGAIGTVPYTDVLPSVHLKYKLNRKQNLRLSYFSSINRPGFFEYVPYLIQDDNFSLSGNPKLKHTTANSFDFRYEYFPKAMDQVLIGAFYKTIDNPIETAIQFNGTSSATLQPANFGTATNYGFEFAFTKYWGHVGVSGNYTYTHSAITTSKLFYDASYVAEQTTQTRPLQGQSPHIANASLLYKNPKMGLDAQLACIYTGRKITFVSPYRDLDYWQRSTTQLDFSLEKRVRKHFTVYCKVTNLLNTPVLVEIMQPNIYKTGKFALPIQTRDDRVTVQKDYYGQNYLLGIRYNFTK